MSIWISEATVLFRHVPLDFHLGITEPITPRNLIEIVESKSVKSDLNQQDTKGKMLEW